MIQEELESQLSAMFDGELPAAECELLSRRIDRDEHLRARWARYALIGAAMRSEPVATARSGFAGRVSAAIEASSRPRRLRRGSRVLLNGALAASLVTGVAIIGVSMLRSAAVGYDSTIVAQRSPAAGQPALSGASIGVAGDGAGSAGQAKLAVSYVTPSGSRTVNTGLRTELADYIVAHSAFSAPLLQRSVLSDLVTGEDQAATVRGAGAVENTRATGTGVSNGRGFAVNADH